MSGIDAHAATVTSDKVSKLNHRLERIPFEEIVIRNPVSTHTRIQIGGRNKFKLYQEFIEDSNLETASK